MTDCQCDQVIDSICPLCDTKTGTDKQYCEVHDPVYICGKTLRECRECRSRGLTLFAGYGGRSQVIDSVTQKAYYLSDMPLKPIIRNFPGFDTRTQICHCHEMVEDECGYCSTFYAPKVLGQKKRYCPSHDDLHAECKGVCHTCKIKYNVK